METIMIPDYEFENVVDNTMDELRRAGEAAWRILEEWHFNDEEKIQTLGFVLTEQFPDGSINDAQTQAISAVIEINNMLFYCEAGSELIWQPLGMSPFGGRDIKDAIITGGNAWGFNLALDFLAWLYFDAPWPFDGPAYLDQS
jgi:hypothetical protein